MGPYRLFKLLKLYSSAKSNLSRNPKADTMAIKRARYKKQIRMRRLARQWATLRAGQVSPCSRSSSLSDLLSRLASGTGRTGGVCPQRSPQKRRPPAPFLCTYLGRSDKKNGRPFRFILNHSRATAANIYLILAQRQAL